MAQQNIYDNGAFFEGYQKLRQREANANNLFEIPERFALLPDLTGLRILDLGCGTGEHEKDYINMGAKEVVGIDISDNMLEVARTKNNDSRITYIKMPMEDLGKLEGEFDLVVSALAIHYIEDFEDVVRNVNRLLVMNGEFIFSQEHPVNTCNSGKERWTKDENGVKIHANLTNYAVEGERDTVWFVDNVKIYHRKISTVINSLVDAGFAIEKLAEPVPSEEILEKYPEYYDLKHKPDFLLVKARKTNNI